MQVTFSNSTPSRHLLISHQTTCATLPDRPYNSPRADSIRLSDHTTHGIQGHCVLDANMAANGDMLAAFAPVLEAVATMRTGDRPQKEAAHKYLSAFQKSVRKLWHGILQEDN